MSKKPNILFVFADQWRAQALGYAGDPNVHTPRLDALSQESVNFTHAISGSPVCSPYRASLMTGQYPLTHGVFLNDVRLEHCVPTLADAFSAAGYDTAYIGKWHLDGPKRSAYIPPERRLGFSQYWKVLECTHDYNHSAYYEGECATKKFWDGYDAIAQTNDACRYIAEHDRERPFLLMLSWGPPHEPYDQAPERFRRMYDPARLTLRPNVPANAEGRTREWLAGYYAHCSALDECVGHLLDVLEERGLRNDTIVLFTSDHGDMLGSHGQSFKQRPWDESIRVPFLLRYPGITDGRPRQTEAIIDAPDLMPTLLGLCGMPIPETVEGVDFSNHITGGPDPSDGCGLIMCPHPFGQYQKRHGGREFRGLRTRRHTYVRDLNGPWLLYDNETDPYQLNNLADDPGHVDVRAGLDRRLAQQLQRLGDEFRPGMDYVRQWGYHVGKSGTVPYEL